MKLLVWACGMSVAVGASAEAFFANGIKVGEVDQDSALLWTRLTRHLEPHRDGDRFKEGIAHVVPASKQLPEGKMLADMEGAVPGEPGEVRCIRHTGGSNPVTSTWQQVSADSDFTARFPLTGLEADHVYSVRVEERGGAFFTGSFRTAPAADAVAPVTFAVVTGQDFDRRDDRINGHRIYPHMQKLGLDFFVHTGDIEYYDKPRPYATNRAFARFKMARMYGLPNLVAFHRSTPSYFIKDDHDTTRDDAWPGQAYGELTWSQGLALFREHFPVRQENYRTIRWGKDLQIWLVEGRDFRSPNPLPDGPEKSIWGTKQKAWFFRTVAASEATFKVLISPTPVVGPDRDAKNDNHANQGFTHEGDELRAFMAAQKNMFVVCGDRHWQYVSVDAETGVKEFSCGPTSDRHAGGWSNDKRRPEHRYLNVQGGFLTVTVERRRGEPTLIARHFDVHGTLCNEDLNP